MANELARAFERWQAAADQVDAGDIEFDAVIDRLDVLIQQAMPPALGDEPLLWTAAARFEELLDLTSRGLGIVPEGDEGTPYRVMLAVIAYRGVLALDRLYDVIAALRHGAPELDAAAEAADRCLGVGRELVDRYRRTQRTHGVVH